ncbi:MAG: class I SAM-dependent methyltransferase, partial [Oscillatoria sp. PMC 1076.18]|nr:class I SAM-dependent methyltransferase [Oscillatoria sp. PMC 1076.18]
MQPRQLDVCYIPSTPDVVTAMLAVAEVSAKDILYDLGCGDGRVAIAAAKNFGTRCVGIDIDPIRIQEAQENARKAQVTDLVQFYQGNLFNSNFREATVITLYLLPHLNLRLRSQFFPQLQPGTKIVSHDFDMGDWEPQKVLNLDNEAESII